jgi:hypothetical protein
MKKSKTKKSKMDVQGKVSYKSKTFQDSLKGSSGRQGKKPKNKSEK